MSADARTRGRTWGAGTILARVDARVKVVVLMLLTVALFVRFSWWGCAVAYLGLAACVVASGLTRRTIVAVLKPCAAVMLAVMAGNALIVDGGAPVTLIGPVGVDPAGALRGLRAAARLVALVGYALVVGGTTTPMELADAAVRLMRPLQRVGVPVGEAGLALSLALRFAPLVAEEFQRITRAQRARGIRFDEGGLLARIRRWTAVFTPLIVALLRRADRTADALTMRCPAGGARLLVEPRRLHGRDMVVLAMGWAMAFAIVFV